jgi:hypothetical protein
MSNPGNTTPAEVAVRRFDGQGSAIAVFEFQGELRDLVVSSLRDSYLSTGAYVADAKAVSSQGVLSMAVAGVAAGGTAMSAALSGSLYMATADPTTLMKIGQGVGSAVMGVNGIAAQAPFIPIAGALPVMAPLMAMQALTTVVTLKQFQQVDRKLDAIKNTLDTAIARAEATHVGELLTASGVVDEVYGRYEREGHFSSDMLIRLALAERDVRTLAGRFRHLLDAHSVESMREIADAERANYDAHATMLASFVDLRTAYLRVCVDMQEHPKSLVDSVGQLKEKLRDGTELWQRLLGRSAALRTARDAVTNALAEMSTTERLRKGPAAEKRIKMLNDSYVATMESEKGIMKGSYSLIRSAEQTLESLESPKAQDDTPTLVYWQDETGEHSFTTTKLHVA